MKTFVYFPFLILFALACNKNKEMVFEEDIPELEPYFYFDSRRIDSVSASEALEIIEPILGDYEMICDRRFIEWTDTSRTERDTSFIDSLFIRQAVPENRICFAFDSLPEKCERLDVSWFQIRGVDPLWFNNDPTNESDTPSRFEFLRDSLFARFENPFGGTWLRCKGVKIE